MALDSFLIQRTKRSFVLLLSVLIFVVIIPYSSRSTVPTRLQPILLQLAVSKPNHVVPVIVQLHPTAPTITRALANLGGKQTKDLHIINAIVVELSARQLPTLANLPGVRWISLDAPVIEAGCNACVPTNNLRTVYNQVIGAEHLWNNPPYLQGKGIGIAVVDSGIQTTHADFTGRIVAGVGTALLPTRYDEYGHGTFVAGIIGGSGAADRQRYIGVAPQSTLIDVKVTTPTGASTESDVLQGLQWIYENRTRYNIRVVNLSLNASAAQSYHTSPLSAACEILWFNGVVVVTSAGNRGEGTIYPPANDPFVITVGATDDMGTATMNDDTVAHFSAYGQTIDGFAKPDLVVPGRYMMGPLASSTALLPLLHPQMKVNDRYMRMSGTSFAAPVVSGAIALLLQHEPHLTPDQVKSRLLTTANRNWPAYDATKAGAGYLDIAAAVRSTSIASANTGLPVSTLLTSGGNGVGQLLGTLLGLNWDSVSWSSVSWSSVSWSSVSWSSVSWSSDYIESENGPFSFLGLFSRAREDTLQLVQQDALMDPLDQTNAPLSNQIYLPLISSSD